MNNKILGRAWKFGDNVDTDQVCPGKALSLPLEERAALTLVSLRPEFPERVRPDDIIVAGVNFGCGSSREQAADVMKALGVGAIIAESFGRIFYRNLIAIGVPVLICPGAAGSIQDGDELEIDIEAAKVIDKATGAELGARPLHPHILEILKAGGIINKLKSEIEKNPE